MLNPGVFSYPALSFRNSMNINAGFRQSTIDFASVQADAAALLINDEATFRLRALHR